MDINEIKTTVANVHNIIVDIDVKGDSAIRMAQAITLLRDLFSKLKEEPNKDLAHEES